MIATAGSQHTLSCLVLHADCLMAASGFFQILI